MLTFFLIRDGLKFQADIQMSIGMYVYDYILS